MKQYPQIQKNEANQKSLMSKVYIRMKSLLFVLLITIASGFSVVSCGKDNDEEKQEDVANLSTNTTSMSFGSGGGTQTVYVTSNGYWSVALKPNWCNITPTSGSGNTTVTVAATRNTATSSRTGNIELSQSYKTGNSSYATKKVTISATQAGSTPDENNGDGSPTIPSAPTGVTSVVNGASVNISWNSVYGATNYFVYRSSSDGVPYTQIQSTSSTTATDASPLDGLNYYKITAANTAGESTRSSFAYCRYEDKTPPATPTGVSVRYQNYYLVVSWNTVPGATRYAVWSKRPILYGDYMEDFLWVDAPSTIVSFQWPTMYLGTYTFWVVATNNNYVNSAPSNKVTYNLNK